MFFYVINHYTTRHVYSALNQTLHCQLVSVIMKKLQQFALAQNFKLETKKLLEPENIFNHKLVGILIYQMIRKMAI